MIFKSVHFTEFIREETEFSILETDFSLLKRYFSVSRINQIFNRGKGRFLFLFSNKILKLLSPGTEA